MAYVALADDMLFGFIGYVLLVGMDHGCAKELKARAIDDDARWSLAIDGDAVPNRGKQKSSINFLRNPSIVSKSAVLRAHFWFL